MRSSKRTVLAALWMLGLLLALANLWFTAARSTIPLALQDRVATREVRREKHRGRDDVHLLHFASGRTLRVDPSVYAAAPEGSLLEKPAWSPALLVDGRPVALAWSADARGMAWAMPLVMLLLTLTACALQPSPTAPSPPEPGDGANAADRGRS